MKNNNIKKNYRTPDNYFDSLEESILSRTVNAPKENKTVFKLGNKWMSWAAGFVIICGLALTGLWISQDTKLTADTASETDYLVGMEDDLFSMLIIEKMPQESAEEETLADMADFLIELEQY